MVSVQCPELSICESDVLTATMTNRVANFEIFFTRVLLLSQLFVVSDTVR